MEIISPLPGLSSLVEKVTLARIFLPSNRDGRHTIILEYVKQMFPLVDGPMFFCILFVLYLQQLEEEF